MAEPTEVPGTPAPPATNFEDTVEERNRQRERAAKWVGEKWKNSACTVCTSNNWQVGDVYELRQFHGGNLVLGGGSLIPVVPVTCNVCGHTVFVNAVVSGVVNVVKPAAGDDEANAESRS